ncbi:hemerythrin domain-containing protein [Robertmurraya korlensis]|uniref:hemerythrin domain-containing protein n=1 Tax=Robertmurraya korlensis TaxID=519977 RepID=UPI00203D88CE|nr:hemerythrin domain-containing protein [Robertmurraya korlensis]MCM3603522.1 hemerythrin domain-containing protein [Robertmurraya korlensis]
MQGCMSSMMDRNVELCEGLQQLKNEHPPLLLMLDELLDTCQQIESVKTTRETMFQELIQKVQAFFHELEPHSEREEGVLFSMMEKYIGRESGPIAVMEYEHDQAKGFIGTFLKAAHSNDAITDEEILELAGLIKNAYFTLVDHFAKEENVLFPMAQNFFTEEEKQELKERINQ